LAVAVICSQPLVRSQSADTATLRAIDREALRAPMGYAWLEWSTRTIGHRLTGTENGRRAEETADSLFRSAGLHDVAYFPFEAVAWQRRSVRVEVSDDADSVIAYATVALAMTPDSVRAHAPLVDVGNGLAVDFIAKDDTVRGAIVLMNLQLIDAPKGSENLHRSEKTALAIKHGAAGVLFVNNVDGHVLLTGTASVSRELIAIPAACIGKEDGAELRAWLKRDKSLRASIAMCNSNAPVTARNVIATIPGTDRSNEVIVVGGHLDSWDLATGATDNGLGSYSILDLARCYTALGLKPKRTIKFILFMGEEQGLLGSHALVEEWKRTGELAGVRCMINMDMSGHPSGFNTFGPDPLGPQVIAAQQAMRSMDTTFAASFSQAPGLHSDHQSFMMQCVPTMAPICDLGDHVYHCYHSSCDDVGLVDPAAMTDNVRRVGQMLWTLANADSLPTGFTDGQLRDKLRAEGLEEKLRLQNEWRW
jgi:carboxypeptidase Q